MKLDELLKVFQSGDAKEVLKTLNTLNEIPQADKNTYYGQDYLVREAVLQCEFNKGYNEVILNLLQKNGLDFHLKAESLLNMAQRSCEKEVVEAIENYIKNYKEPVKTGEEVALQTSQEIVDRYSKLDELGKFIECYRFYKEPEKQYQQVQEIIANIDKLQGFFDDGVFLRDAACKKTADLILDQGNMDFTKLKDYRLDSVLYHMGHIDQSIVKKILEREDLKQRDDYEARYARLAEETELE